MGLAENGKHYTTRRPHLEDLVAWLKSFALTMWEDPYPLQIEGGFAAQKDSNAREFDTDGMQKFDVYSYYDSLDPWTWEHTRSHESGGAVLSNIYFELKDGPIELSWDNRGCDPLHIRLQVWRYARKRRSIQGRRAQVC